jgi:hypothetical protein
MGGHDLCVGYLLLRFALHSIPSIHDRNRTLLKLKNCYAKSRYRPHSCVTVTIMSSEAALNLSVLELLRALNEKLGLKYTKAREIRLPPVPASVTLLETEVSLH